MCNFGKTKSLILMPIPTSRAKENAKIIIDKDKCTVCGLCVEACSDFSLLIIDNTLAVNPNPVFGCIACGHCMAVCPQGAITILGRTISSSDLYNLPPEENKANYEQLLTLLKHRRSIRKFKDKAVEKEKISKIIEAALTAPMGLPPSDVHLLVIEGKDKTHAFAKDFCNYIDQMKWFVSPWFLTLMRPFWGKANDEMFRGFIRPTFKVYTEKMKEGRNVVNYDPPLLMYFYGSPYTDPADPIVAATYAMIAAESLGLGTIMLGAVHPLIQNGRKAKKSREKHGIKYPSCEGLFVAIGYPHFKFKKGIKRTFAAIDFSANEKMANN